MKRKSLHKLLIGNSMLCLTVAIATVGVTGCRTRSPMQDRNTPAGVPAPPVVTPPVVTPPVATTPANPNPEGTNPGTGGRVDTTQPEQAPITAILTTDKATYQRGDRISFTITARNNTQTIQTLQFFSGQSFDITARPEPQGQQQTQPVWRWSNDMMFTRDMPQRKLAPGASQTWTATWNQTDNNGNVPPRGRYILEARIVVRPAIAAAPLTISLED